MPRQKGQAASAHRLVLEVLQVPAPPSLSPEVKGVLATYASRSKKTASLDPHKRKAIGL